MTAPTGTPAQSIVRGALGFMVVSIAGFAVWAFAGNWFYRNVGEAGLYAASAVVFIGLAGLLLHPLLSGTQRVRRFYLSFVPAFMVYVVVWSVCWFVLKFGAGEWLGSVLGCAAFAAVLARSFPNKRALPRVIVVLFLAHSAGYFAGSILYMGKIAPELFAGFGRQNAAILSRLLWGVCYGLGFGAGIGYAYYALQKSAK